MAPNIPNNIPRNKPFIFVIVLSSINLLTTFINKPEFLRDLTIFMMFSIFSFEIINAVVPEPRIISWICAPVTDTLILMVLKYY